MKSPKPPQAPDPVATANAQAGMNRDSAVSQQLVNMTNQVTPQGTLTYNQTGTRSYVGSDGKSYTLPAFTATTTYSPDQQRLYDLSNQTQQQIGQIGLEQSKRIGDLLGKPVDLSNEATESRLYDLGRRRLDPQFARDEEALRARLSNQGLQVGSQAWNSEMQRFDQGRNDAYNQLLLNGRGQAVQEALSQRNQPINEISALLSGSQVSQPNFMNTPQAQVAPTDYIGAVRDKMNNDYNIYNSKMGRNNQIMGGLFSLGSSVLGLGGEWIKKPTSGTK